VDLSLIDKSFPLDKITDALAMMRANQHFGKIVVVM
jgi:NADPH:quinone reductase-like Zn-dependent oxidoreductase